MIKRIPIYPLLFALAPLLYLLARNTDPLRISAVLQEGALWLAGGLGLYLLVGALTRRWERAALLAVLVLALIFFYDPVYELLRGQALMGIVVGKHRYLAPAWGVLAAAAGFLALRGIRQPGRLTPALTFAGAALLAAGIAWVSLAGAWTPALRVLGVLPPPGLEVTFIDVGQLGNGEGGVVGDAILLRTTEGKTMLIDGGYPNEIVIPYLRAHGVDHLDLMLLTHAHDDHSGGLINVAKSIPVGQFIHNGQTLDTPVYSEMRRAIADAGIPERTVLAGEKIALGSLTFEVISPHVINPTNHNNSSIVLRLAVGRVTFLFTGDSDQLEEKRLLAAGEAKKVDILKIAHHGADSASTPAYIAAISPEVAIYSAGAGNMHALPHAVTLNTLRDAGAAIYGTDINGTIVVRTDGRSYEVIPSRGEPLMPAD